MESPAPEGGGARVRVDRNVVTQQDVDNLYGIKYNKPVNLKKYPDAVKAKCTDPKWWKGALLRKFPVVNLIKTYQWKKWIFWDILAGVNVGMVHIPQSMGFSLLAQLPPVYGLYTTFFHILPYFIFGTSRHISVGTMAVPSILLGSVVNQQTALRMADAVNGTGANGEILDELAIRVDVAASVTFLVGCFQMCMGLLGLSVITRYMSAAFISGFLLGVTCIILTAQAAFLLGITAYVPLHDGWFRLVLTWYDVFRNIHKSNIPEVICSIISLSTLIILKMVINEKCKSRMKIPIPAELIVLVLGTLISHFANFHERYGMNIVGHIPSGFPTPHVPSFINGPSYVADAFIIAIVSFTISITMAKVLSRKHRYPIDDSQEMLAYGIGNITCSFFNGFCGNQAPPRTLVHEGSGGKTQLASIVSAFLVFLVIIVIGQYIEVLPKSVLASIITVALLPMFSHCKNLKIYWKINKPDIIVWLVTFLLVIIVDIVLGLGIGIGLALLFVVFETSVTKGSTLTTKPKTEGIYVHAGHGDEPEEEEGSVRIFSFNSLLFFANIDTYNKQILTLADAEGRFQEDKGIVIENEAVREVDINENSMNGNAEELNNNSNSNKNGDVTMQEPGQNGTKHTNGTSEPHENEYKDKSTTKPSSKTNVEAIICDCAAVSYIDIMSLNRLKELNGDLRELGIKFVLAACRKPMLTKLKNSGYPLDLVYPTVQDAVCAVGNTLANSADSQV